MLVDSVLNAKEDVAQRMVIEARTEGEQMVYTAERFIEKNKDFLSEDETTETKKLIEILRTELRGNDKDKIHTSIDALNEFTRPFAERLMDHAISHAMKGKSIE